MIYCRIYRLKGAPLIIGISTACFYPTYPEKTLDLISRLGFREIEVFLNSDSEFSSDYIRDFSAACRNFGLHVLSVHPFTSFAEPQFFFSGYDRRFAEGLTLYKKYFSRAALLGAQFFNFHGAFAVQDITPQAYAEIFQQLSETARAEGIVLSQENVARCKCGKLEYLEQVCRLLDTKIAVTLDLKQAHLAGEDPASFLASVGGKMVLCHINDYDGTHKCMLPGAGSVDYVGLKKQFAAQGYSGDFIIEVYSDNYCDYAQIQVAREFLETIF